MLTDLHMTRQIDTCMTRQTPILKNNLAEAMSYNPGFKSIGGSVFKLESRKHTMDGCVHAQNGKNNRHQFQNQFQIDETKCLRVSLETKTFQMSTCPKRANGPTQFRKQVSPGGVQSPG